MRKVADRRRKLGLCDGCLNKYGTPAAAVAALGIGIGAKFFIKNVERL